MAQRINNAADATLLVADLVADLLELFSKEAWATTGIGYATGAGGAVTQLTSKSTSVTLSKICGQITTSNASLAAGASVAFAFNNSLIAATDVLVINRAPGGTENAYRVLVDRVQAGAAVIVIENKTGGALAEALVINFAVIKAVNA